MQGDLHLKFINITIKIIPPVISSLSVSNAALNEIEYLFHRFHQINKETGSTLMQAERALIRTKEYEKPLNNPSRIIDPKIEEVVVHSS